MARGRRRSVALYGAGRIARAHAGAAQVLGMPIVGIASRGRAAAEELAAQVGSRRITYDGMPAGADIVMVCTPPHDHFAAAAAMLRTGAAVIVERPLCTTLADADELVTLADASGGRLLYAENLAYSPAVQRFIALSRTIGPIETVEVRSLGPRPDWGEYSSPESGGGVLFDVGVHPLAIAALTVAPTRISGVSARIAASPVAAVDDDAEVVLHLADGRSAKVVASWRHNGTPVFDAQVSSATGVVRLDFWPTPVVELNGEPVPIPRPSGPIPLLEDAGYVGQLQAFDDDLANGREPLMSTRFGRGMLDLVCAAYASAADGGAIEAAPFAGPRHLTPHHIWTGKY